MPLSDTTVRSAKGQAKLYKLSDGGGLQLWVHPDGARRWRVAYRFGGLQKALAVGVYPAVTLKGAREARDEARRVLASGQDPMVVRRADRAAKVEASANTFDSVADALLAKKRREKLAAATLTKMGWLLDLARPAFGRRPIGTITAPEVLAVLRSVENRGRFHSAGRLRSTISQVFRLAVAEGRTIGDPTSALRGALTTASTRSRAAITDAKRFGELLRSIDDYTGAPETRIAMQLLALTFVRPGELRGGEWREFDLDAGLWVVPAERMKRIRNREPAPHRVPLAPQTVELLRELHAITGRGRLLFPSVRTNTRPISENTINAALRRLGWRQDEMTAHGFRSAASSMLNECGQWHPDAIERQLSHIDGDAVRRAYARADFWPERVRMMTWWGDRIDAMRAGDAAPATNVVRLAS